ncbi:MAG: acyl carrier protein [bacterium]
MYYEKIIEIIKEHLAIDDVSHVTPKTSLMEDLEVDSLDAVEIIMKIEDAFGVDIPDEDVNEFKNLGDIASYVKAKKEG